MTAGKKHYDIHSKITKEMLIQHHSVYFGCSHGYSIIFTAIRKKKGGFPLVFLNQSRIRNTAPDASLKPGSGVCSFLAVYCLCSDRSTRELYLVSRINGGKYITKNCG